MNLTTLIILAIYFLGVISTVRQFMKVKPQGDYEWGMVFIISMFSWLAYGAIWFGKTVDDANKRAGMDDDDMDIAA